MDFCPSRDFLSRRIRMTGGLTWLKRLWYRKPPPMMDGNSFLALLGRVFIATIYLAAAFGKITNFDGTTQYMAAHGVPMVSVLCVAAIIVEVLCGLSLVLGFYARWAALALFVFMVPVTLLFHLSPDQRIQFLKNVAIMGGLLQVVAYGPGDVSLDRKAGGS